MEETDKFPIKFTGIVVYPNGSKHWVVDGNLHRIDGPAIESSNGTKEWCVDDKEVTELECKLLCDLMKLKGLL